MSEYEKARREAFDLQFGGQLPRPMGFHHGYDAGYARAVARLRELHADHENPRNVGSAADLLEKEANG